MTTPLQIIEELAAERAELILLVTEAAMLEHHQGSDTNAAVLLEIASRIVPIDPEQVDRLVAMARQPSLPIEVTA